MSNPNYSKETVLLEAVRSVLVGDNTYTGTAVSNVYSYVGSKVLRSYHPMPKIGFPQVNMHVHASTKDQLIDTQQAFLNLKVYVEYDDNKALEKLDALCSRIETLLHNQVSALNTAAGSKYLRCRRITRLNNQLGNDDIMRLHVRHMIFTVQMDDETVNSQSNQ